MRALARWGITPLLATPLGAWALGLGDIELQSALNQPFQAQIRLVSATPEELQGLRVVLASPETFTRYGLDRPAFLSALEFRVVAERDGRGVVRVSSRESIAEPFVTLLVEANWPRGRLLREYTVLLDPPVFLPAPVAPPAVRPAETRAPAANAPGGVIDRPAPAPAARAPAPAPAPRAQPSEPLSSAPPSAPRIPAAAPGGTYGPVQRAETLWAIAERFRPQGITINQMMMAIYRENPDAFGGNINLLRAGTSLRLPETTDFETLSVTLANAEVQRHTDQWLGRSTSAPELRLLPPAEAEVVRTPAPVPAPAPAPTPSATTPAGSNAGGASAAAPVNGGNRPLEVGSQSLQAIQQQAAAIDEPAAGSPVAGGDPAAPGVDLESEQLFADEAEPEPAVAEQSEPAAAPAPAARVVEPAGPSLVSQVLEWVLSPLLWIGLGVAALLFTAMWFVRRRQQQEPEDVTGRWEALESEVDDEQAREATARMRRQVADESLIVEEQQTERPRRSQAEPEAPRRGAAASAVRAAAGGAAAAAAATVDETLSSQTVINLDQADAVAEADFHMAYGLYDQAAELVQKAIEAAPDRRDLKLKLLEVYFVWGNKDAFLKAAQGLRRDIGDGADADWDKVVIMGRQICPDERLFSEATTGPGRVDVDLQAGDSPLDLAFDDALTSDAAGSVEDIGAAFDIDFGEPTAQAPIRPAPKAPAARAGRDRNEDSLDIGERTAAGLEAALFLSGDDDEDTGRRTTPDLTGDSLAVTQESPTIERPGAAWASVDSPTAEFATDAPTVETPTVESLAANAPTMEMPTVETPFRGREPPTVEQPALGTTGDFTAEINLDDLGLDVKDIEGLPGDLGDLPMAADRETDTREQPALQPDDDDLLSATGVTQVLHGDDDFEQRKTSVLGDQDATMLAPGFDDGTMTGTEVLDGRFEVDESGDTSLVRALRKDDNVDLDLADLTAALHGADTVEQPRASSFSRDVFGGGDTPVDLDIGADLAGNDDPTGTEEANLDPQTMTEVGTKLDLARAYIDMGDPEGARSILEEVLDEGDPNQRREAQSLIDVLRA